MKKYIREIFKRKDLLVYLVTSGLKAEHRNSYLGYFWWLLDPLMGIGIYYFLMVILLGRGGPDYGGFLVIGMISWRWVMSAVKTSTKSISSQSAIITKVYLPKIIFPLTTSVTQLINFSFGLIIIVIYLILSRTVPTQDILWLPFIMLVQYIFLLALGMIVAFICVFVRDVDTAITHLMRLWFYSSPVIWERSILPEQYALLVKLNPISYILTSYRNIFLNNGGPEVYKLSVIGLGSLAIIIFLTFYYSRNEHKIIKAL
jgi:lipopolysaccharide transport system permease protein/teichoic acid transport system permease protein